METIQLTKPQRVFQFNFEEIINSENMCHSNSSDSHSLPSNDRDAILNRTEILDFEVIRSGRCDAVVFWHELFSGEELIVTSSPFLSSSDRRRQPSYASQQALQYLFIGRNQNHLSDKNGNENEREEEEWFGEGEKKRVKEGERERILAKHNGSRIWFDYEEEERKSGEVIENVKVWRIFVFVTFSF